MSCAPRERRTWLASLKAGDEVLVGDRIVKITRITNNGRFRVDGDLYDGDGEHRHDRWTYYSMMPITPEALTRRRIERLRQDIKYYAHSWDAVSPEQIEAIAAILWPQKGGAA